MAVPTGRPSLVTPLYTYCSYFVRGKTDTFCSPYAVVLRPYKINMANTAATITAQSEIIQKVYSSA